MTTLSLGQMTALDVSPTEYIDIAAGAGCQQVSLMVRPPSPQSPVPTVTADNIAAVEERLAATGLEVLNAECFMLTPQTDVRDFASAMALGQRLHARGVTVLTYDNDEARVVKNLSQLCAMARDLGLRVNLEFMPLAPICKNLQQAQDLIKKVGASNLGIGVDFLHLVRAGNTAAELAEVPDELIYYAQICDSEDLEVSEDYALEAGSSRLSPGAGKFPLAALLSALPDGTPVEIEVPQGPGEPAAQRVKNIADDTRRQLDKAH